MITLEHIGILRDQADTLGLEHRDILDRYGDAELARIYNGIGPDRFPEKLRALITRLRGNFEPVAIIHDVEYHEGGDDAEFRASNQRFAANGIRMADLGYRVWDPRRWINRARARRYAWLCQRFGWAGWAKK